MLENDRVVFGMRISNIVIRYAKHGENETIFSVNFILYDRITGFSNYFRLKAADFHRIFNFSAQFFVTHFTYCG